jgi:hypothetical protein
VNSLDILLTLVFSVVMLLFMSFPAMKLAEYLQERFNLSQKSFNIATVLFTVILSLIIGLFLRFG